MKPIFSLQSAWCCISFSIFSILILTVFAIAFNSNNEELAGHDGQTTNAKATGQAVVVAIIIYAACTVCCFTQVLMHKRQPISLR